MGLWITVAVLPVLLVCVACPLSLGPAYWIQRRILEYDLVEPGRVCEIWNATCAGPADAIVNSYPEPVRMAFNQYMEFWHSISEPP
jgi:hypothetical protein